MYPRSLEKKLLESVAKFPVVTITVPRQSGKSTLFRGLFPNKPYVNLESSREREFAINDPIRFLAQYPEGAILDEIQKAPGLISDIQVIVDEQRQNGQFLLSGSENLSINIHSPLKRLILG
jgi:predicted AAA+ superfamily ATPase